MRQQQNSQKLRETAFGNRTELAFLSIKNNSYIIPVFYILKEKTIVTSKEYSEYFYLYKGLQNDLKQQKNPKGKQNNQIS